MIFSADFWRQDLWLNLANILESSGEGEGGISFFFRLALRLPSLESNFSTRKSRPEDSTSKLKTAQRAQYVCFPNNNRSLFQKWN